MSDDAEPQETQKRTWSERGQWALKGFPIEARRAIIEAARRDQQSAAAYLVECHEFRQRFERSNGASWPVSAAIELPGDREASRRFYLDLGVKLATGRIDRENAGLARRLRAVVLDELGEAREDAVPSVSWAQRCIRRLRGSKEASKG